MLMKQLCFLSLLVVSTGNLILCTSSQSVTGTIVEQRERESSEQALVEKQANTSGEALVLKENSPRKSYRGVGFVLIGVANLILGLIGISQW